MNCHEARRLLYDIQLSRVSGSAADERASLVTLATAHLHVCLACTEFFEHERALIVTLRDRLEHSVSPVPPVVFQAVLSAVHQERLTERGSSSLRKSWWSKIKRRVQEWRKSSLLRL